MSNEKQFCIVAVDLGGSSAKCAVLNKGKKIIKEFSVPTIGNKNIENSDDILKNLKN